MEVTKTVETAVENKGNAMFTHPFSCLHVHTHTLTYMHTHAQELQTIREDKAHFGFYSSLGLWLPT